jgi:hypothetical protein
LAVDTVLIAAKAEPSETSQLASPLNAVGIIVSVEQFTTP